MAIPWKPVAAPRDGDAKPSHHTKAKGDLGVLKAQLDLFEQGDFGSNATLRVERPKNGQVKGVKYASDCRRAP